MIDDNHYDAPAAGTPATEEARKSAESDADDDAEWEAREAIVRARGGR